MMEKRFVAAIVLWAMFAFGFIIGGKIFYHVGSYHRAVLDTVIIKYNCDIYSPEWDFYNISYPP